MKTPHARATVRWLAAWLLIGSSHAGGKPQVPSPAVPHPPQHLDTVEVKGLIETTIGSYQDLLAGSATFHKLRPSLSPEASLRFALPAGIRELYVKHPTRGLIPIPLDPTGEFDVPLQGLVAEEAAGSKWPLLVRSVKVSEVLPVIRSPASSHTLRSVGDLRLYCETLWATQKANASAAQKMALRMMGGMCHSKRVAFHFPTTEKVKDAMLEGASPNLKATISYDALGFAIPLHDRGLPNNARVRLTFGD